MHLLTGRPLEVGDSDDDEPAHRVGYKDDGLRHELLRRHEGPSCLGQGATGEAPQHAIPAEVLWGVSGLAGDHAGCEQEPGHDNPQGASADVHALLGDLQNLTQPQQQQQQQQLKQHQQQQTPHQQHEPRADAAKQHEQQQSPLQHRQPGAPLPQLSRHPAPDRRPQSPAAAAAASGRRQTLGSLLAGPSGPGATPTGPPVRKRAAGASAGSVATAPGSAAGRRRAGGPIYSTPGSGAGPGSRQQGKKARFSIRDAAALTPSARSSTPLHGLLTQPGMAAGGGGGGGDAGGRCSEAALRALLLTTPQPQQRGEGRGRAAASSAEPAATGGLQQQQQQQPAAPHATPGVGGGLTPFRTPAPTRQLTSSFPPPSAHGCTPAGAGQAGAAHSAAAAADADAACGDEAAATDAAVGAPARPPAAAGAQLDVVTPGPPARHGGGSAAAAATPPDSNPLHLLSAQRGLQQRFMAALPAEALLASPELGVGGRGSRGGGAAGSLNARMQALLQRQRSQQERLASGAAAARAGVAGTWDLVVISREREAHLVKCLCSVRGAPPALPGRLARGGPMEQLGQGQGQQAQAPPPSQQQVLPEGRQQPTLQQGAGAPGAQGAQVEGAAAPGLVLLWVQSKASHNVDLSAGCRLLLHPPWHQVQLPGSYPPLLLGHLLAAA